MLMHWNYERPINHELQRLRRVVIADQLAARGWNRNGARFDYVVDTKLRKVRYLTHCRFDAGIDHGYSKKHMPTFTPGWNGGD